MQAAEPHSIIGVEGCGGPPIACRVVLPSVQPRACQQTDYEARNAGALFSRLGPIYLYGLPKGVVLFLNAPIWEFPKIGDPNIVP